MWKFWTEDYKIEIDEKARKAGTAGEEALDGAYLGD